MVFHYNNNRRRPKSTRDAKFELGGLGYVVHVALAYVNTGWM